MGSSCPQLPILGAIRISQEAAPCHLPPAGPWSPSSRRRSRRGCSPLSSLHQPVGRGQSQPLPPLPCSTPPTAHPRRFVGRLPGLTRYHPVDNSRAGWTSRPMTNGGHGSLHLAEFPRIIRIRLQEQLKPDKTRYVWGSRSCHADGPPAPERASERIKCVGLRCLLLLAPA